MVVLPLVIVPVLVLVAPSAIHSQNDKVEESVAAVAVVVGEDAQRFLGFLSQVDGVSIVQSVSPEADLTARKMQAVIGLPAGFGADIAAEKAVEVEITYDAGDQKSAAAQGRLLGLPGIATQYMPAADAANWAFAVPLLNAIFVYKELLEGIVNWTHIGTVLVSSLVFAYLCLQVTVALFRKEQVVFRT